MVTAAIVVWCALAFMIVRAMRINGTDTQCTYCGQAGHRASRCPRRLNTKEKNA